MCWNTNSAYSSYVVKDTYSPNGFNVGNTNIAHLTGLPASTTITAQVAGVTSSGQQGTWSNIVTMTTQGGGTAVPAAPSAYDCSANNSGNPETEVVLCWDLDGVSVSYVVQDQDGYNANVGLRNNAHLSGLTPGTTIWAKVAGVNSAGQQGPWSNVVYMTTAQQQQLATPSVYQCGTVTSTEVDICWGAVSGAYQYEVNNTLGADFYTAGTIAHFTGASPGETFSARVRAVDIQGNYSNWSTYITLQTLSSLYG